MNTPAPIANGIRTDHPIPGLPFVDDSVLNLSDPESIENIGRGKGEGRWGRTDLYGHLDGAWRAFATDPANADYAWLVVHHPQNGTSVSLYKDDDVVKAYSYRDYDNGGVMPLILRNGGYWSDGTVWRRPTAVTDPVTHKLVWDEPLEARCLSASDFNSQPSAHSGQNDMLYSLAQLDESPSMHVEQEEWTDRDFATWSRFHAKKDGALPLDRCVLEVLSPELWHSALLNNQEAATLAGVEASTWRAYVSRGTAPDPQKVVRTSAFDKGRPYWSAPIVEAWIARRDRDLSSRAAAEHSPADPFTDVVIERINETVASWGRRVFKARGRDAIRRVLKREIIGIALRDHTSASMHSAWMADEYHEEYGLPDFVAEQVISLIWLDAKCAEDAIRRYVVKGVQRGYEREKLEKALSESPRIMREPRYVAIVERALTPYWE